jgi:hypothetical protein
MNKSFDIFKELKELYAQDDFYLMTKMVTEVKEKQPSLAYCDYIAHLIQMNLKNEDTKDKNMLSSVGRVNFDLAEEGFLASTKKTIFIEDRNDKKYRITVEEMPNDE